MVPPPFVVCCLSRPALSCRLPVRRLITPQEHGARLSDTAVCGFGTGRGQTAGISPSVPRVRRTSSACGGRADRRSTPRCVTAPPTMSPPMRSTEALGAPRVRSSGRRRRRPARVPAPRGRLVARRRWVVNPPGSAPHPEVVDWRDYRRNLMTTLNALPVLGAAGRSVPGPSWGLQGAGPPSDHHVEVARRTAELVTGLEPEAPHARKSLCRATGKWQCKRQESDSPGAGGPFPRLRPGIAFPGPKRPDRGRALRGTSGRRRSRFR